MQCIDLSKIRRTPPVQRTYGFSDAHRPIRRAIEFVGLNLVSNATTFAPL
jgi:hypothetical protein